VDAPADPWLVHVGVVRAAVLKEQRVRAATDRLVESVDVPVAGLPEEVADADAEAQAGGTVGADETVLGIEDEDAICDSVEGRLRLVAALRGIAVPTAGGGAPFCPGP
jgi:hypothetical protein